MRIAAAVEYCGSGFNGWQRVNQGRSVQQSVEDALSFVADEPVSVICAGRTDAGVHAHYQVIHFDTGVHREMHSWVLGANANLPDDVSLLWAKIVNDDFHARFSALKRAYTYAILNRPSRSALYNDQLTWEYRPLDDEAMGVAAAHLLGKHDFTSYRAQACQAHSPVREVFELSVRRQNNLILIHMQANAFLYHMVRNVAGVLIEIGCGKQDSDWTRRVLDARDRSVAAVTAPPNGLYLVDVLYPTHFEIPGAEISASLVSLANNES